MKKRSRRAGKKYQIRKAKAISLGLPRRHVREERELVNTEDAASAEFTRVISSEVQSSQVLDMAGESNTIDLTSETHAECAQFDKTHLIKDEREGITSEIGPTSIPRPTESRTGLTNESAAFLFLFDDTHRGSEQNKEGTCCLYRLVTEIPLGAKMTQYKLTYFDVMGLGEPIRLLLSYGNIDFQDIRIKRDDWPAMKSSTPFGQLPLLEIDGKPYAQTLPICRYLAKQLKLIGKTDLDALEIDAVANALHDLRKDVALFYRETDPIVRVKRKTVSILTTVPFYLNKLEALVNKNGGYFHGGELSYADIFFIGIHDSIVNACGANIMTNRSGLKCLREKVLAIAGVKSWIEKRPKNDF